MNVADPLPWQWAAFTLSFGACAWYVWSLFIGRGRTPYDIAAGTQVETRDGS